MYAFAKIILFFLTLFYFQTTFAKESEYLDIYKIDLNSINSYRVLKEGSEVELIINNDIASNSSDVKDEVNFTVPFDTTQSLSAKGNFSNLLQGKRFSNNGQIRLTTSKIYLSDGQEIDFAASSKNYKAIHPSHADSSGVRLARTISNFALGASPLTFGSSLGISFLVSGFLSARLNGAGDFIWGGFDGAGFSFIESLLRRQPDIKIQSGTSIPFILTSDLKINNGIQKINSKDNDQTHEESILLIKKLISWGDLSGALEVAHESGEIEIYNKLVSEITSKN